jgi:hypothetical protein
MLTTPREKPLPCMEYCVRRFRYVRNPFGVSFGVCRSCQRREAHEGNTPPQRTFGGIEFKPKLGAET